MPALLSMKGIRKSFFGVPANDDVSLEVGEGEIHALLGENGAGKTTLMNVLYGIYARDAGEISFRGEALEPRSPGDAIARGIGMVHQHFMLVSTMTVSENITLGLRSPGHPFPDRRALDRSISAISARYGLGVDPGALVSSLSVGEQQRVEIMKLLYRDARLLILDEPTAVLTPAETDSLFLVLGRLRAEGHSVILITHRIPEVLAITDRITVLRDGAKMATLDTREADPESLSRLMIGRSLKPVARSARPAGGEGDAIVLGLSSPRFSLSVGRGEIAGIAGVDGNGQKELAERILGLRPAAGLTLSLDGRSLDKAGVAERKALGIAYVSDDRHGDGLVLDMSLAENFMLNLAASGPAREGEGVTGGGFVRAGFIQGRACRSATEAAMASYSIKAPSASTPVRLLSGGNQQKLVLARELSGSPRLIVAFQPTRGLDIGATEFIRERLLERRASGCAILLISADLEEILAMSDSIRVIYDGRLSEPVPNDGCVDLTRLGLLMAGHDPEACA